MSTWRKRSCPECGHVDDAGAYRHVEGGGWGSNARRACPSCHYEARTSDFRVVDEWEQMPTSIVPRTDRCIVCGRTGDLVAHSIPKTRVPVWSCKAHDDLPTVRHWYGEWQRFKQWSGIR